MRLAVMQWNNTEEEQRMWKDIEVPLLVCRNSIKGGEGRVLVRGKQSWPTSSTIYYHVCEERL